jgi:hypothetical protein
MIMDMTRQRFVADRIFASGGGVTGGAVVFDSVEANDNYASRDVERVAPGAEFPIITSGAARARRGRGREVGRQGLDQRRGEGPQRQPSCSRISCGSCPTRSSGRSTRAPSRCSMRCSRRSRPCRRVEVAARWRLGCRHAVRRHADAPVPGRRLTSRWLRRSARQTNWGSGTTSGSSTRPTTPTCCCCTAATASRSCSARWVWKSTSRTEFHQHGLRRRPGPGRPDAHGAAARTETWREPNRERTWVQSSVRPLMFVDNRFAALKVTNLKG